MTRAQLAWWIGLFASVATALVGQAELLPEPWRHVVTVLAVAGTAASGYMIRPVLKVGSDVAPEMVTDRGNDRP